MPLSVRCSMEHPIYKWMYIVVISSEYKYHMNGCERQIWSFINEIGWECKERKYTTQHWTWLQWYLWVLISVVLLRKTTDGGHFIIGPARFPRIEGASGKCNPSEYRTSEGLPAGCISRTLEWDRHGESSAWIVPRKPYFFHSSPPLNASDCRD